jgi:hypothetical protein
MYKNYNFRLAAKDTAHKFSKFPPVPTMQTMIPQTPANVRRLRSMSVVNINICDNILVLK